MFMLKMPVTGSSINEIKAELTQTLPDVKSSHRCEAVARGLGYRTYAALLEATRRSPTESATVHASHFITYLAAHGFEVAPLPFYKATARVALRGVSEKVPRLTTWGVGIGRPTRKSDGSFPTWQERRADFDSGRSDLLSDYAIKPFLLSLALLGRVKPTKTIRQYSNSYWLKHIAENYECTFPHGARLGPQYVPNGIFIAAAVHAGFEIKTHMDDFGYESLNVTFNMSKPSLLELEYEIRPESGRSQDRRRLEQRRAMKAKNIWLGLGMT